MSKQTAKRGRPAKPVLKTRQNISVSPAVLKKAKRLAFMEGVSLSAWLERMMRERVETPNPAAK